MIIFKVDADKAIRYFIELQKQVRDIPTILVGSDLIYSYGIERGVTRSGKLARAAGGVFYLAGAVEDVSGKVGSEIVQGLENGNLRSAFLRLGLMTVTFAQARVVVVTGSLRRSLHMVEA